MYLLGFANVLCDQKRTVDNLFNMFGAGGFGIYDLLYIFLCFLVRGTL